MMAIAADGDNVTKCPCGWEHRILLPDDQVVQVMARAADFGHLMKAAIDAHTKLVVAHTIE